MKKLILLITILFFATSALAYETVVFKYGNETAFHNRLASLALAYKAGNDEDGNPYRTEQFLGLVSTPHLENINGDKYFTARLAEEDADKIPNNNHNPAFAIIWRDTETCDYGSGEVLCEWPEVIVINYDEFGNPDGYRSQGVGRIQ